MDITLQHLALRARFLRVFMENRNRSEHEHMVEVYQDKSYVHQYHHLSLCWFLPENDDTHRQVMLTGARWCFSACITTEGSYWVFSSNNGTSPRRTTSLPNFARIAR